MIQSNQSEPTSKIPWHKTPEGKAKMKAYKQSKQSPEHKAQARAWSKAWYKANRERQLANGKAWREANIEKAKAHVKAWYEANPEKLQAYQLKCRNKRLKKDPLYAAKIKLRNAVCQSFKRIAKNKPADTQTLLGCSWEQAKAHFESLFKEGMSWENHGEWHIDHIRPVSSFTEAELHLMNHISNLQPLWAHENMKKKDRFVTVS